MKASLGRSLGGNARDKTLQGAQRAPYLLAALCTIAAGLAIRLVPLGLTYSIVKYGGSTIWGAMVYALVAACAPSARICTAFLVSVIIAALSEFFRLYHTPELDAFRMTLAGALLLGRVFSVWNIVAYSVGIALAALADTAFRRARVRPRDLSTALP